MWGLASMIVFFRFKYILLSAHETSRNQKPSSDIWSTTVLWNRDLKMNPDIPLYYY